MTITYIDVETTFVIDDNKRTDPSPFNSQNRLVSIQYAINDKDIHFHWFHHKDLRCVDTRDAFTQIQIVLNNTTLLVGHNIKFDLIWLWESGFKYTNKVYDTMIGEYLLLRQQKQGISLSDSCVRRNVAMKSLN